MLDTVRDASYNPPMKLFILALFFFIKAQAQVDNKATVEVLELYKKLNLLSLSFKGDQKILLGHQNAFSEGRGWSLSNANIGEELKSDMHMVSGLHPAVLGLDFLGLGQVHNQELQIEQIKKFHERGGVITLSWHMPTLINDGIGTNSYDDVSAPVVQHILPGGVAHEKFLIELWRLIRFLRKIPHIPIIFRPFHEHTESWFWWGKKHCTKEEYIKLWRFTVDYLRAQSIHQLLYAYSPNEIKDDYLERYPGDGYVDVLGVDMYFRNPQHDRNFLGPWPLYEWKKDVIWLMREASKRNKIPAITEFGQESVTYDRFWTDYFGWPLERAGVAQLTNDLPRRGVAYIMLWRNDTKDSKHFFGPSPGHKNNGNFMSLLSKKIFMGLR